MVTTATSDESRETTKRATGIGLLLVGVVVVGCALTFRLRRRRDTEEPEELVEFDALASPAVGEERVY